MISYGNSAIRKFVTNFKGNFIQGIDFFGACQCGKNLLQAIFINPIHFPADLA
jgi:hypothetical protein